MKKTTLQTLSFYCLLLSAVSFVHGDEVTDAIEEASSFYTDNNFGEAVSSLNYAVQLINEKASQQLGDFLPPAPDGWDVSEPELQTAGASFFGGGNAASKVYTNGDERIEVSITANSAALQSMLMLVNNPAFLGASGKKIERFSGQKAIVEWSEDGNGTINVIVAGTALVTVDGSDTSLEMLKSFAEAIDYKKLVVLLMQ